MEEGVTSPVSSSWAHTASGWEEHMSSTEDPQEETPSLSTSIIFFILFLCLSRAHLWSILCGLCARRQDIEEENEKKMWEVERSRLEEHFSLNLFLPLPFLFSRMKEEKRKGGRDSMEKSLLLTAISSSVSNVHSLLVHTFDRRRDTAVITRNGFYIWWLNFFSFETKSESFMGHQIDAVSYVIQRWVPIFTVGH